MAEQAGSGASLADFIWKNAEWVFWPIVTSHSGLS